MGIIHRDMKGEWSGMIFANEERARSDSDLHRRVVEHWLLKLKQVFLELDRESSISSTVRDRTFHTEYVFNTVLRMPLRRCSSSQYQ